MQKNWICWNTSFSEPIGTPIYTILSRNMIIQKSFRKKIITLWIMIALQSVTDSNQSTICSNAACLTQMFHNFDMCISIYILFYSSAIDNLARGTLIHISFQTQSYKSFGFPFIKFICSWNRRILILYKSIGYFNLTWCCGPKWWTC